MGSSLSDLLVTALEGALKAVERGPFLSTVSIDGIEVTQEIQYYGADQHLTDAADRGPDNSIRLVMFKPAWVRVYVRSRLAGAPRPVRGRLIVERLPYWLGPYGDAVTFDPVQAGSVPAQHDPGYQAQRSTIGATLNFLIPADAMHGQMKLTAQIWPENGDPDDPADSQHVEIGVVLQQTLKVRGIMISYDGPNEAGNANLSLNAPTVADLTATTAWTLTTMPVQSQPITSSAGTFEWGTPLTGMATGPGGCSQQWLDLNVEIAEMKANDGNRPDVVYYGLLPAGIPIANVGGCATLGVTSGSDGDGGTMAHEIGHACGLGHGPCGTTSGDPAYPAYEPYDVTGAPTASLGEYGLDINNGQIRQPAEKDVMSYCPGDWFSIYHYKKLIDNPVLNPVWAKLRPDIPILVDEYVFPWEELIPPYPEWENRFERVRAQPLISVIAVVGRDEEIDVRSVTRVNAAAGLADAAATPFSLQLLDAAGKVIGDAPAMRLRSQGGCRCAGCGGDAGDEERPPYVVQAMLPDVAPGKEMRVIRREEGKEPRTLWSRKAPDKPPRVGSVRVEIKGGRGVVRWSLERGKEPPRCSIQFSKDDGRSWNSLAIGVKRDRFAFDPAPLPSGKLVFRVLAHDGFHTATAVSKPVKFPERPPLPAILHPRPDSRIAEGQVMRLWGSTVARGPIDRGAQKFRWQIDGKDAGAGAELWVAAPKAGKHSCELIVEDANGKARTSVEFETIALARKKR